MCGIPDTNKGTCRNLLSTPFCVNEQGILLGADGRQLGRFTLKRAFQGCHATVVDRNYKAMKKGCAIGKDVTNQETRKGGDR